MKNNNKTEGGGRKAGAAKKGGRRLASIGLPADSDCRLPCITVTGDSYVRVEHHCGVLRFSPGCVRLYSRLGIIRIEGEGLAASSMDGDELLLDGRVSSVSFE
ncbi:MAG: sporulation protein YqfC [Clostridia bacterium]|nr:sporulation protein YqfC [Clostridia bacterium]